MVKISSGRKSLDLEKFLETVSKKWKIAPAKLQAIVEISQKESKKSLSKRVVEL